MKSTTKLLFEKYNTITGRPTVQDPQVRQVVFKAFRRTLGAFLPANKDARILDVACGEGALLAFLKEMGYRNLAGFDLSPENVAICHQLGLDFVKEFNALELVDFSAEKFDVIFALDILEHIHKEKAADFVKALYHILNPGGYAVIQTPNMGYLLASFHRFNDLSHEFCLTENTAIHLFKIGGFEKVEIYPAWNATTAAGYAREVYLRILHFLITVVEGSTRPRIPTKNLLIVGRKGE